MADECPPVPGYETAADLRGVTELRVHGVSGTPPSAMLQHPNPEQVVRGKFTGFFRRPRWAVRTAMPGESDDPVAPRRVEAYSWGGLTSGASSRAFWLLLLPFALVNAAAWMHPSGVPSGEPRRRPHGLHAGLARLLALSLTATLVLAAIEIGPDLVGWQCSQRGRCAANHSWTAFLAKGFWHQPSRAVAATTVLPLAVIALVWFLGRQSWLRYEARRPASRVTDPTVPLGRPDFWDGEHVAGVLRSCHVSIALLVVAVFLAAPGHRIDDGSARWTAVVLQGLSLAVAGVAAAVAVVAETKVRVKAERIVGRWLVRVSLALVVSSLGYALIDRSRPPAAATTIAATSELPGFVRGVFVLFALQLVLLLLLTFHTVRRARRAARRRPRTWPAPRLFGVAGPVLSAIAVFFAAAVVAGAAVRFADWLGTPKPPSAQVAEQDAATRKVALAVPTEYPLAAIGFTIGLGCLVLMALAVVARTVRHANREAVNVERRYGVNGALGRARGVARYEAFAKLPDSVGSWVLLPLVALGVALAIAATVIDVTMHPSPTIGWLSKLETASTWIVGLLPLAMVIAYRAAHTRDGPRRTIGIMWDVTTFWPRSTHPLAPPCYSERTVPDLTDRMRLLTENGHVILSTHSQGTVIGVATLLQLEPDVHRRTFLMTYGCPLARLYARYFPAYFGGETLGQALHLLDGPGPEVDAKSGKVVPRWWNYRRHTDPIGGEVFPCDKLRSAMVDQPPLVDPAALTVRRCEITESPIHGHSDYWDDSTFLQGVDAAARRLDPQSVASSTQPG